MTKRPVETKKVKEKTAGQVPDPEVKAEKPQAVRKKSQPIPDIYWYVGLAFTALISFYLRAIIPAKAVFIGSDVRFSSESDAWYHMMLAKSTVINLHRTFYDPLTNFPFGTSIHFGPFMDWGIAIISLILGLGHPSMHTVDVVGAYWPALMGTLLILPCYYIGRELGGKGCGFMAALFIAIFPGQLFSRTVLGFTDHHSSEALMSAVAMLFFMLAARTGRDLTFESLKKMDFALVKTPLIYTVLGGIFLGLYIDTWSLGVLFLGILLIFMVIQLSVDHIRGRNTEYLGVIGGIGFTLAFLLVLPFANSANGFSIIQYSYFQPTMLLFWGTIFSILIVAASRVMDKRGVNKYAYPGAIAGIAAVEFLVLAVVLPKFIDGIITGLTTYLFPRTGGAATVAELSPLLREGALQANFPGLFGISPFYFALIALALLIYRYAREERSGDLLIIVWSLVTLAITIAANRSAYYYTVNVAILCAYLGMRLLDLVQISDLRDEVMDRDRGHNISDVVQNAKQIVALGLIALLIIWPSLAISVQTAQYTSGPQADWYSSTSWLQNNTPDPGLSIYGMYQRPPDSQKYEYPNTAYGIMSWWDYGHLIETIGHRYPNANPFQEGIGSVTKDIPGSSPFFLAENESTAEKVLADLDLNRSGYMNTKYVMTDVEMAVGKFGAMAAWSSIPTIRYMANVYQAQGEQFVPVTIYREPYFKTMVARLQFFDGTETPVDQAVGIAYRGMEVQSGAVVPVMTESPKITTNYTEALEFVANARSQGDNAEVASTSPTISPMPIEALQHYRLVHESENAVTSDGQKYVKTFEHVPGATIKGKASPGTRVLIAVPIMTNHQRGFVYSQSNVTDANGEFTLVVPYSTEGPTPNSTNFDTAPISPYQLAVGNSTQEVNVPEALVENGGVINI